MKRLKSLLLTLSSLTRFKNDRFSLIICLALILCCFTSCVTPYAPYQKLSDEQIASLVSPPYSRQQIKQAQVVLKNRQTAKLQQSNIEQELKYLACLMVKQSLDPSSADGKKAPDLIPCLSQNDRKCKHECKRSRLPRDLILPQEYTKVAQRHDEVLWSDLEAVSKSGAQAKWSNYLKRCLICKHSPKVKRLICLRDAQKIDLTAKREPHSALDRWLNQCESSVEPQVRALISYRTHMLTPPEDLPYPLNVAELSSALQSELNTRSSIGEAIRLLRGPLDAKSIKILLNADYSSMVKDTQWLSLTQKLQRRLDAPLMPCLEHGLSTCFTADQIQQARKESRQYVNECKLCEHKASVNQFRAHLSLGLEARWSSHQSMNTQARLSLSPPSLMIKENSKLSHLSLIRQEERLKWLKDFGSDSKLRGQVSLEYSPKAFVSQSGQESSISNNASPSKHVITDTAQALYGIDPVTGVVRWSHRHPFDAKGHLKNCQKIELIPAQYLALLNDGGVLCWRKSELSLLNQFGETVTKLACPNEDCGNLLGKYNQAHTAERPANTAEDIGTKVTPQSKRSSHETSNETLIFSVKQTKSHLRQLQVYPLRAPSKKEPIPVISATQSSKLIGAYLSANLVSVSDQTQASSHTKPLLILIQQNLKRKLELKLVDPSTGNTLWTQVLKGRKLLQQPSVKILDSIQKKIVALLTDQGFYGFDLNEGSLVLNEGLRLKRRDKLVLEKAFESPVSWTSVGQRVILLHTLNQALYFSQPKPQLKSQMLKFDSLDPQAYLSSMDQQWLIVSPESGKVFGLPPQLDQVVWQWTLKPFNSLILSQDWALVSQQTSAQLFRVLALKPQTTTENLKNTKDVKDTTDSLLTSSLSQASDCSAGDRWDCLIQGDALIDIDGSLSFAERNKAIATWFTQKKQRLSSTQKSVNKLDALVAQGAWSAACQWGVAPACMRLGLLAELGLFSSKIDEASQTIVNYKTAYNYHSRAAKLGDMFATERLGKLLELGQGTTQNYAEARVAYFKACEAGYAHSCARWGFLNELGLGGPKKKQIALMAYQKACYQGSQWACDHMKNLESK